MSFDHDPEHQRFRQVGPSTSTLYLADAMGSGVLAEWVIGSGGSLQWNNYLIAGGEVVGMEVEQTSQPVLTRSAMREPIVCTGRSADVERGSHHE